MATPTILLFGTVHHPVLTVLYHYLQERGKRRVVFLANEAFPRQPAFFYQLSKDGQNGRLILEDETTIDWDEIVSVGLDGYFVAPEGLDAFNPTDQEYLQTESWAALIALFEGLAARAPVANHVMFRDALASRVATLAYLSANGLPVPDVCVTSDPDRASEFVDKVGSVVYRPLSGRETPFQVLENPDRLDRLPLCPVHFEAVVEGETTQVVRIGERWMATGQDPPEAMFEAMQRATDGLNLHLAELSLRKRGEEWFCMDVKPFVGPGIFANEDTADILARFFER